MHKVTVLYPAGDGATFDMEYYRTKHVEIVNRVLKPSRFDIDEGLPGQPFLAIGNLVFDSGEAMADVANFTNTTPTLQISRTID